MAALKKAQHERFAALVKDGRTASEAFEVSGLDKIACGKHAGYYVYALVDPRADTVFYIGKGIKRRFAHHLAEWRRGIVSNAAKFHRIGEIVASGMTPQAYCLASDLDEQSAYALERAFIQAIGRERLTNDCMGQQTDRERAAVLARRGLKHIKSFCVWMLHRPSDLDVMIYWDTVRDFHEMANLNAVT